MNLNSLFKHQKKLDDRIVKEKRLEEQDLFKKKIVALLCELYECTNEMRVFKFWSENQKPNNFDGYNDCTRCKNIGRLIEMPSEDELDCPDCEGSGTIVINPLLEEYADVIHFTISIANDLGYTSHNYVQTQPRDLNDLVIGITNAITVLAVNPNKNLMQSIFNNVIALGYQLGFNEEQVIAAYHDKNKENHSRQSNGY